VDMTCLEPTLKDLNLRRDRHSGKVLFDTELIDRIVAKTGIARATKDPAAHGQLIEALTTLSKASYQAGERYTPSETALLDEIVWRGQKPLTHDEMREAIAMLDENVRFHAERNAKRGV
jgi:hypothetical protein